MYKKITTAAILAIILFSCLLVASSCLGKVRTAVAKKPNPAIKGKLIFINYPISNNKNEADTSEVWHYLTSHFSPANKKAGLISAIYENNIKNAHLFLQIRLLKNTSTKTPRGFLLETEITIKNSFDSKYYLREQKYNIFILQQNSGERLAEIKQRAYKKLADAIAYFLQRKRLPTSSLPIGY